MDATIYHNPKCGTSRNTLALLREAGIEPTIIEYLKTPPDADTLRRLGADSGLGIRGLLRRKGTPFDELGLGDESLTDDHLIAHIQTNPVLIERPIVVTPLGTRLCRPMEKVREIMPG